MGRKRRSWIAQLNIRLLTGRFQVRILVAEPFELVLDLPAAALSSMEPRECNTVRSTARILVAARRTQNRRFTTIQLPSPTGSTNGLLGVAPTNFLAGKAVLRHQVGSR